MAKSPVPVATSRMFLGDSGRKEIYSPLPPTPVDAEAQEVVKKVVTAANVVEHLSHLLLLRTVFATVRNYGHLEEFEEWRNGGVEKVTSDVSMRSSSSL
jgi:hypothetical protein